MRRSPHPAGLGAPARTSTPLHGAGRRSAHPSPRRACAPPRSASGTASGTARPGRAGLPAVARQRAAAGGLAVRYPRHHADGQRRRLRHHLLLRRRRARSAASRTARVTGRRRFDPPLSWRAACDDVAHPGWLYELDAPPTSSFAVVLPGALGMPVRRYAAATGALRLEGALPRLRRLGVAALSRGDEAGDRARLRLSLVQLPHRLARLRGTARAP